MRGVKGGLLVSADGLEIRARNLLLYLLCSCTEFPFLREKGAAIPIKCSA